MNVLHIATAFERGGAANSLRLLHHALRAAGHESRVLVGRPTPARDDVEMIAPMPWWGRISYHSLNLLGLNYAGIPTTGRIAAHPWFAGADVVHYHNLHGGYFNYLALPALTRAKPSVWTLRDMWGLTGHCAHSFECARWRTGCGRCPYPGIDPPIRRDATRIEWRLKRSVYRRSRMIVTAPSRWLTDLARQSILGLHPVRQVDNAVDTARFKPGERTALRRELGWPADGVLLLFAAESMANPFKHFDLLLKALRGLSPETRRDLTLVMLGDPAGMATPLEGIRTIRTGYLDDDAAVARCTAAADLFVYPTRADNQPRVLLEAMACECPVISVNVGGVPELIRPDETGYLARAGDADDVRRGIEVFIADPAHRARMAANGRRLVLRRHALQPHLDAMLQVYQEAVTREATDP
jgi:glycosyltransferase involved in cell wall biosynthesis